MDLNQQKLEAAKKNVKKLTDDYQKLNSTAYMEKTMMQDEISELKQKLEISKQEVEMTKTSFNNVSRCLNSMRIKLESIEQDCSKCIKQKKNIDHLEKINHQMKIESNTKIAELKKNLKGVQKSFQQNTNFIADLEEINRELKNDNNTKLSHLKSFNKAVKRIKI